MSENSISDAGGLPGSDHKAAIRLVARAAREALLPVQREALDHAIAAQILGSTIVQGCSSIVGYRAFGGEANVDEVLSAFLSMGRRVFVPRIRRGVQLELCRIPSLTIGQEVGSLGIIEPAGSPATDGELAEIVLVPGIAFDAEGNRVGFGRGYYDRLLARIGAGAIRIGVAYECQIVRSVPVDPWDQPVHWLATELGVRPARAHSGPRRS